MKKLIIALLTMVMALSLFGCSSGGNKLSKGETFETDMINLTIEDVELGYYGNPRFGIVSNEDWYVASAGHVLAAITFTVENKDRASLNIGSFGTDWSPNWNIKYNGKEYPVNGYDFNAKDGKSYIDMSKGCLVSNGMKQIDTSNYIQKAGSTVTYMVICIIGFDPKSLTDSFDLIVDALSSSGKKTTTYTFN